MRRETSKSYILLVPWMYTNTNLHNASKITTTGGTALGEDQISGMMDSTPASVSAVKQKTDVLGSSLHTGRLFANRVITHSLNFDVTAHYNHQGKRQRRISSAQEGGEAEVANLPAPSASLQMGGTNNEKEKNNKISASEDVAGNEKEKNKKYATTDDVVREEKEKNNKNNTGNLSQSAENRNGWLRQKRQPVEYDLPLKRVDVKPALQDWYARVYESTITFKVWNGVKFIHDAVSIYRRVAMRCGGQEALVSQTLARGVLKLALTCRVATPFTQNFATYSTKYSNIKQDFSLMDLAALIEQLACGISVYANYGKLPANDLAAGQDVNIVALTQDSVANIPSTSNIYIPRCVDSLMTPSVFCAIVKAAAACGATIVTDVVQIDAVSRRAVYAEYEDASLAAGCYEALRLLGGQYEASGCGDIFALAFFRGLHRASSVIGHSDEGGIMRKLLRSNSFSVPYGGINVVECRLNSIPAPIGSTISSWRNMVDSFLLLSAAAVAECDPGMEVNGKFVPYVSTYPVDERVNVAEMRKYHQENVSDIMGTFSRMYVACLSRFLCIESDSTQAATFLCHAWNSTHLRDDRHLNEQTIAPFYWIEPTGVIPEPIPGISLRHPGIGCFTYAEGTATDRLKDLAVKVHEGIHNYDVACKYTSLRSDPFLRWLSMRQDDGLAHIDIVEADPGSFALAGPQCPRGWLDGGQEPDGFVTLDKLRWRYSDCPAPKPAEALYLGEGLVLNYNWCFRKREYNPVPNWFMKALHTTVLPSNKFFDEVYIETTTSRLQGVDFSGEDAVHSHAYKHCTRGLRACAVAHRYRNATGSVDRVRRFVRKDVNMAQYASLFKKAPDQVLEKFEDDRSGATTKRSDVQSHIPTTVPKVATSNNPLGGVIVHDLDKRISKPEVVVTSAPAPSGESAPHMAEHHAGSGGDTEPSQC